MGVGKKAPFQTERLRREEVGFMVKVEELDEKMVKVDSTLDAMLLTGQAIQPYERALIIDLGSDTTRFYHRLYIV